MLSVIVRSMYPLYPRDETAYHRRGFRDGVAFGAGFNS